MSQRRPTIIDVARAAGVSKGAVSFALNGRPGVAEETRRRILAVAKELGWTPSHRARALSTSRAFAVGLVLARPPELLGADPFFPAFIAGVERVLAEQSQALVLQVVTSQRAEEDGYRRLAADGRVDGVFLLDLRVADPRIALLEELGLPAVTLGRPDVASPFPAVLVDDRPGIAAAVRHLVELGHRHVAHVAGPDHFLHGSARRDAWENALRDAGLSPGPACRPTSRRPVGPEPPTTCSTWPTRRARSSTPTT
ncbi:LacI family DNA-binding transcriptional regulator [Micromonospora sp. 4G55]|uniref:LacI family DNA-binding transcriptional regulator n=1 Tax=Micromonospora sp. 4G55 TaxID=2806102 RepID=UPI001A37B1BB|nr:LacI family DNA-binding transcriptional regulator [Micromonospora sp. 4G55]MBM0255684.1 LacI family DNA-binding transcriptional regulator [Micromonospora sp. 4G55]